jgi:Cdc6-like AAA superfamily ATPase
MSRTYAYHRYSRRASWYRIFRGTSRRHNLRSTDFNRWNHLTSFNLLESIEHSLRLLGSETLSTAAKLEKFGKAADPKSFILVLDEIDKVATRERNIILYRLASIGNLSLICIADSLLI